MNNPFKISGEKLKVLIGGYEAWLKSDPKEEIYPESFREASIKIKKDFLTIDFLSQMSDDELYDRIFKYSRKLEGPAHIRLGEPRIRGDLDKIRRNLMYIMTSKDSPFMVAQNILDGELKIEVFAKAFWSPLLLAQFPNVLPNWNNKTENFLKKFGINISTSRLSISEKYQILSEAFTVLSGLKEGNDFYRINHLMHYGTVIPEGMRLIDELIGNQVSDPVIEMIKKDNDKPAQLEHYMPNIQLNTILYGSPGTGKTFHSISHSVAIVENRTFESVIAEQRESVKERYDRYVKEGQIVFCTFHQSLGYEDFIEGIKPNIDEDDSSDDSKLEYGLEDGIFKQLCTKAGFSFIEQNLSPVSEKVLDFSIEYDRFVDSVNDLITIGKKREILTISGQKLFVESISQKNNIVIRHIKGTRSYIVSKQRLSKISQAFPDLAGVTNINDQFRSVIGGSNASAYWSVLNAIRNQPADTSQKPNIDISEKVSSNREKKDLLDSLSNEDYKIPNPKKFVLVIDEINRGNVSQIFGELITLIEEDKRLGKEEALKSILPYSKENFGVPCNLYIIGTMNTADRSVEALDTALRRRFSFISMKPKPEELTETSDGINLPELLRVLNRRLSILKDEDHTIGHAWLWDVKNFNQLKTVFANKILPLLQEYFYNDYEKLGLVLGDAFFELPHKRVLGSEFASFSGSSGLIGQYRSKYLYKLKDASSLEVGDFLSLIHAKPIDEN